MTCSHCKSSGREPYFDDGWNLFPGSICFYCKGNGFIEKTRTCRSCEGTGHPWAVISDGIPTHQFPVCHDCNGTGQIEIIGENS